MGEIGILIHPKKKTPEEEKKEKEAREKKEAGQALTPEQTALLAVQEDVLTEVEVSQIIQSVSTFDPDYLDYYNFLECIVRVTNARPWSEEERKEMPDFDNKLDRVCALLEGTYHDDFHPIFAQDRENIEHERRYQPRIVVDDEEEGNSDDDDMQ